MRFTIRLVLAEDEYDFINHAREETVKAMGCEASPEALAPLPAAIYLVAYDTESGKPLGMAETAFHHQVYPSFEEGPYPDKLNLSHFCNFGEMAGLRTVFVEPEHRVGSPLYLYLILSATKTVESLGGKYGTATTVPTNHYLRQLYSKTGGECLGTFDMNHKPTTLYLFEVKKLMQNKVVKRALRVLEIDSATLSNLQRRGARAHSTRPTIKSVA